MVGCCNSIRKTIKMATGLMHVSFYKSQWLLDEAETISLNYSRLSIWQMFLFLETFLQLCFPSFLLIYIKERERWMWLSHGSYLLLQILAEPCSWKGLISLSITSLLVVIHSSKISFNYGGQAMNILIEYLRTSSIADVQLGSKYASGW